MILLDGTKMSREKKEELLDPNWGIRRDDKYRIFSNTSIKTLKDKHNLLMGLKNYRAGLERVYYEGTNNVLQKKWERHLFKKETREIKEAKLLFIDYVEELVGFRVDVEFYPAIWAGGENNDATIGLNKDCVILTMVNEIKELKKED